MLDRCYIYAMSARRPIREVGHSYSHSFSMLAFVLFLACFLLVDAQNVNYRAPWVASVVSSATSHYKPWVTPSPPKSNVFFTKPNHTAQYPFPKPPQNACAFWMEEIQHQGLAPYQSDPSYKVFRNVKDFGAKGDGITDDTAAINLAISTGDRCAPGTCASSTTTPATVYFPPGTYVISSSIVDYYYTNIIGNPNCLPVIQASSNFTAPAGNIGLIDADPYGANGLSYGSTNTFFRYIRSIILDTTQVPANASVTGIHWPTAQATSLQNIVFYLSDAPGTQHQGVFCEEGSGGFMTDLVVYGGLYGFNWGNQQFTMRNLTISNAVTAINQLWDWSWAYKALNINNCSVGLNMSSGAPSDLSVTSITMFDSVMSNTPVGILTGRGTTTQPPAAGSLIIENCQFQNVSTIVEGPSGALLPGSTGSTTVAGWGSGHAYTPNGPQVFEGHITPNTRPASLISNGAFYQRSKPQYEQYGANAFLSARSLGVTGNGKTDDTKALQNAIYAAQKQRKILFVDAGAYIVTSTIYIPAGSRIIGESYPVIFGAGKYFSDINSPQVVVQVGKPGEKGTIEWIDMVVSGKGATAGAIFIEYNLASSTPAPAQSWTPRGSSGPKWGGSGPFWGPKWGPGQQLSGPSGLWDVHARIGGFAGTDLQVANCPTTPTIATPPAPINPNCICGFMSIQISSTASNLYLENVWIWTADHDIEDATLRHITVFNGRGMYVAPGANIIWMYGTAVEHHVLYEYQLTGTNDIYMGQIQTETAYYVRSPVSLSQVTTTDA
jgi:glucan 1,3-beta-glucosidase